MGKKASRFLSVLLILVGLPMAGGGVWLVLLGGSPYYLLAGAALLLSAILLWRGKPSACRIYAATLLVTIAWSLWESGLDPWALMPRLGLFLFLGMLLLLASAMGGWRRVFASRATLMFGAAFILAGGLGLALYELTGQAVDDPAFARGMAMAAAATPYAPATARGGDWLSYGNDAGGSRFSPLTQITPGNVAGLQVAWTYRTGAGPDGKFSNLEVTPLKVGSSLYLCTSTNDVIALDAESGRQLWRFRSGLKSKDYPYGNCRGVVYYRVPAATGECSERIYTNTVAADLLALDAHTGRLCSGFGKGGRVSLLKGMGTVERGYYFQTSAPTIIRGKIIMGGWVADGQFWGEPAGVIRAFDAVTGTFDWAFDMGRPDRTSEPAEGETYTKSTPNSWAPMSADEELGLVYVPTGNTGGTDYFGAQRRPFDEKYSTSTVAIDAETGKVRWSFQYVHHDLWDYDVASQPSLVDLPEAGGVRKALIQPTKRGQLFMLDRVTGKPIAEVAEKPVPQNGKVPEERLSRTQPFSVGMPPLTGPDLSERMMWGLTPLDQLWCRIKFRSLRYDGPMTPPGLQGNIVYPGYAGGMNWSSASIDQDRNLLIVNSLRLANSVRLVPRAEADREGIVPMSEKGHVNLGGTVAQAHTPYAVDVRPLLSPLDTPCQQPPYGMLSAIDLKTRKLVWTHPIGTARDAGPFGLKTYLPLPMGMPQKGGSVVTRAGLVFIAATKDAAIRAFDSRTGAQLWDANLPAGGQATPMTYLSPASGRQFVVIAAAGDGGVRSTRGDYIIAYALPKR